MVGQVVWSNWYFNFPLNFIVQFAFVTVLKNISFLFLGLICCSLREFLLLLLSLREITPSCKSLGCLHRISKDAMLFEILRERGMSCASACPAFCVSFFCFCSHSKKLLSTVRSQLLILTCYISIEKSLQWGCHPCLAKMKPLVECEYVFRGGFRNLIL